MDSFQENDIDRIHDHTKTEGLGEGCNFDIEFVLEGVGAAEGPGGPRGSEESITSRKDAFGAMTTGGLVVCGLW